MKKIRMYWLALGVVQLALAQAGPAVVTFAPPASLSAKPGETAKSTLTVTVAPGYHANSNKPADSYLIPFSLTWSAGPVEAVSVTFPKAQTLKLGFSEKPVSVYTGNFDIATQFKVPADAAAGITVVKGKLHYQACDDRSCLPPRTVEVSLPVAVLK